MQVKHMTLEGRVDKTAFLEEWASSEERKATFLQTKDCVYIMPRGHYDPSPVDIKKKFDGRYRRHSFVKRDFEISDAIVGGGYLIMSDDMVSCAFGDSSGDFGHVPDEDAVVFAVTSALLKRK